MKEPEENSDTLEYTPEEARWVWQEAARVLSLHRELAALYRAKSKDKRTIKLLWEKIEDGEWGLRQVGVTL